ncbi:MAG: DUF1559 domain-containing protein, partial [Planctomycetaceae bacterium]|nr:DUF1559 domain-containing protein [Planctomycetaceae bacterium]
ALLLPAVQQAREAARRTQCKNNLKQLGLALHNYHDIYTCLPPGYIARNVSATDPASMEAGPGFAWGTMILPQLDQAPLFQQLDLEGDCTDAANVALAKERLPAFRCPTDPGLDTFIVNDGTADYELALANYVGIYGYGNVTMAPGNPDPAGMMYRNSSTRFRDVTDGLSNTLLVGERASNHDFIRNAPEAASQSTWYAAIPNVNRPSGSMMMAMPEGPGSLVLGHVGMTMMGGMQMRHVPNSTNHIVNFSSRHVGGAQFLLGDGSVHFLSENVDYDTFRWLGQRADGNVIGEF